MATAERSLWKGAINFGLVHIPVSLHLASSSTGIDFDWLDKRSMDPVGYKRINKKTGKDIDKDNIVRGVAYEKGHYVVLSDDEIAAAYPKATQSIDIESFVSATELPFVYLERPYYLAPGAKAEKVYALLRETLLASGRIGLARVVIGSKQHLAALVPSGPALVLNLLRWGNEVRSFDGLNLPAEGSKAAGLQPRELAMARHLVDDMSAPWDPAQFRDAFKDAVMALVKHKATSGQTEIVASMEPDSSAGKSADIIDLTELLKRSLGAAKAGNRSPSDGADGAQRKTPAARKQPAKKAAGTSAPATQKTPVAAAKRAPAAKRAA